MLRYMEETADHVRNSAFEERGHLAVGLPPAIGIIVGPQLIRRLHERWPKASLHVSEGLSTSLQECLLDGRIQVAVVYNQLLLEAFDVRPIFSERMVLVGPPGEASKSVRILGLADFPLILPGLPHSNRRLIEQVAAQNGFQLNVVFDVDSVNLTKRTVAEGMGYSILAHAAVQEDIARGILVGHAIERPGNRSTVSLATLKDRRNSRLALSWENCVGDTGGTCDGRCMEGRHTVAAAGRCVLGCAGRRLLAAGSRFLVRACRAEFRENPTVYPSKLDST